MIKPKKSTVKKEAPVAPVTEEAVEVPVAPVVPEAVAPVVPEAVAVDLDAPKKETAADNKKAVAATKKAEKDKAAAGKKEAAEKAKAEKKEAAEKAKAEKASAPPKEKQPVQNGVRLPSVGTKGRLIWDLADKESLRLGQPVSCKDLLAASALHDNGDGTKGLNEGNVKTEHNCWKRYYGHVVSVAAAK